MALAAEQAGAVAVRIEGMNNLRMTRSLVSVPIIGIIRSAIWTTLSARYAADV